MANTWIANAPRRRMQEAREGRTQIYFISCFGKYVTSVIGTCLRALVDTNGARLLMSIADISYCAAVFCLFITALIVCCWLLVHCFWIFNLTEFLDRLFGAAE